MSEATGSTAPAATTTTPDAGSTAPDATIGVKDQGDVNGLNAGGTNTPQDWTTSFSEDQKAFVTNKGFKDAASVLDSYVNLEKLRGVPQDRLLKLPETADAPEWADVHTKLGKPASADGYGIQSEGDNKAFGDWAKDAFFKNNITKTQAEGLLANLADFSTGQEASKAESYETEVANADIQLKKDWGTAYHQNVASAQRAAKEFGIPETAIDALEIAIGFDGTMKFMHSIGTKLGEAGFVAGNPMTGFGETAVLTPQQAIAQIGILKKDAVFAGKYTSGDAEAKAKMSRLHQMAYPDS